MAWKKERKLKKGKERKKEGGERASRGQRRGSVFCAGKNTRRSSAWSYENYDDRALFFFRVFKMPSNHDTIEKINNPPIHSVVQKKRGRITISKSSLLSNILCVLRCVSSVVAFAISSFSFSLFFHFITVHLDFSNDASWISSQHWPTVITDVFSQRQLESFSYLIQCQLLQSVRELLIWARKPLLPLSDWLSTNKPFLSAPSRRPGSVANHCSSLIWVRSPG